MHGPRSIAVTVGLGAVVVLFLVLSCVGITWGLPSRQIDRYLFGAEEPWPGEKIHRLANAADKFSPSRGADVDADPLRPSTDEPLLLTGTEEDVARIYLRYRLYTYQPDEMITMMALAGMRPRQLQFDPRLYQYGGLFIYPVGALIKLCGLAGLIDVRSDIVFYLDHPDAFGKFYVVARAYSAAWGAVGVLIVFGIARRLGGDGAGLLAALLFALLPVVACMSHEGKPHLPGAVLMLAAVYFAIRCVSRDDTRHAAGKEKKGPHCGPYERPWVWMCVCCGAAMGMVLSSWPVFVLIPLVAWMAGGARPTKDEEKKGPHSGPYGREYIRRVIGGVAMAAAVYCVTNPYVVINLFVNREVLRSNFGNSLAMYEVARIGEGFVRVTALTVEGATLPVVVLGMVALGVAVWRRNGGMLVLVIPATLFLLQFVMIGAGKPAEYGRFGIFYEAALAIGAACVLSSRLLCAEPFLRWSVRPIIVAWCAAFSFGYLRNFVVDTTEDGSRIRSASIVMDTLRSERDPSVGLDVVLGAEPAPYNCPPLPFAKETIRLDRRGERRSGNAVERSGVGVRVLESNEPGLSGSARLLFNEPGLFRGLERCTPISWANKPFAIQVEGRVLRVPRDGNATISVP